MSVLVKQDPTIARIGAADGDVARVRLERRRDGWADQPRVHFGRTRRTRRRAFAAGVSVS